MNNLKHNNQPTFVRFTRGSKTSNFGHVSRYLTVWYRYKFWRYLPLAMSILWLVAVTLLSLLPVRAPSNLSLFEHADKVVHFGFYAVAAVLFVWASDIGWRGVLLLCVMGWLLEYAQHLSGVRHGDIYDGLANMAGAVLGWLGARRIFATYREVT